MRSPAAERVAFQEESLIERDPATLADEFVAPYLNQETGTLPSQLFRTFPLQAPRLAADEEPIA